MPCTAWADRVAFSDGFQTMLSPHTSARPAFHDQTAVGKLNAEMIATGPRGCQASRMWWSTRSETIVRP